MQAASTRTASPPLSKGGFRRDCRYRGGRRPSLSLRKGVCREAFSNGRERGIGYCAALRDADPFHSPWGPLQPKMGFELRSSRAITIENKTQLIAQPLHLVRIPSSSQRKIRVASSRCARFSCRGGRCEKQFLDQATSITKKRQDKSCRSLLVSIFLLRRGGDSNP